MSETKSETSKSDVMVEQLEKLKEPMKNMVDHAREYAIDKPESAMLWCLALGFVLGWKLKIW